METVSHGLEDHEKEFKQNAERAMKLALGKVGSLSVSKTPVDTSNLRRSEFESGPVETLVGYEGVVGYEADYAPPVHENLKARHPVGEAKFLEHALQEFEDDFLKLLQEELQI